MKRSGTPAIGISKKMHMFTPSEASETRVKQGNTPAVSVKQSGTPAIGVSKKMCMFTPSEAGAMPRKCGVYTPSELISNKLKTFTPSLPPLAKGLKTSVYTPSDFIRRRIKTSDSPMPGSSANGPQGQGSCDQLPAIAETENEEEQEIENENIFEADPDEDGVIIVDNDDSFLFSPNKRGHRTQQSEEEDEDRQVCQDDGDIGVKALDDDEGSATSADDSCVAYDVPAQEHSLISVEDM